MLFGVMRCICLKIPLTGKPLGVKQNGWNLTPIHTIRYNMQYRWPCAQGHFEVIRCNVSNYPVTPTRLAVERNRLTFRTQKHLWGIFVPRILVYRLHLYVLHSVSEEGYIDLHLSKSELVTWITWLIGVNLNWPYLASGQADQQGVKVPSAKNKFLAQENVIQCNTFLSSHLSPRVVLSLLHR